jgi:hypothetical protein
MAELAERWPVLSDGERRRMLDAYSPRTAELLARYSAALVDEMAAAGWAERSGCVVTGTGGLRGFFGQDARQW